MEALHSRVVRHVRNQQQRMSIVPGVERETDESNTAATMLIKQAFHGSLNFIIRCIQCTR